MWRTASTVRTAVLNQQASDILHAAMGRARDRHVLRAAWLGVLLTLGAAPAAAQTVELSPFAGYRFGEDPLSTPAGDSDVGTGPSFGGTIDVFFEPGRSITGLVSHRDDRVTGVSPSDAPFNARVSLDHFLVGGTDEYLRGRARYLLTGLVGASYLHGGGEGEWHFTIAGGGGVKWMPARHLGARLDGRVYATFVDGGGTGAGFCTPGVCLIGFDVSVLWQAEFTAGVVVSF